MLYFDTSLIYYFIIFYLPKIYYEKLQTAPGVFNLILLRYFFSFYIYKTDNKLVKNAIHIIYIKH